MEIYCLVTNAGLVPIYDSDLDAKHRLKEGETVLCTIRRPRNYEFHKKFFALVRLTFSNLPEHIAEHLAIHSEDDMLARFKMDLSLFDVVHVSGQPVVKLGSISFARMDNTEFQRFYDQCVDLVQYVYLRGCDRESILREIDNFR